MRELVAFLARSLAARPGEVEVREREAAGTVVLEIHVPGDQVGLVVGRQGRLIRAIRTLARAAASLEGKRVRVEVVERDS